MSGGTRHYDFVYFSFPKFRVNNHKKWSENPFDNRGINLNKTHWTKWSDFDEHIGDIKILWEPSRFNWLLDLSRAYRVTCEPKYLNTINDWLIGHFTIPRISAQIGSVVKRLGFV